uniref:Uncharacterized protein n=1 Tax=Arundo donax TaxID=35708 RepID=A0A0A8YML6_ARUDO
MDGQVAHGRVGELQNQRE